MLNDIKNAPAEFHVLLSAAEWSDPKTRTFKELLANMSEEEFDALEADLLEMEETGTKSRCIEWLESFFARNEELPLAA
ncbi:MAG: hypothetical protein QNJ13_05685 [Paracoccaceae bacterium]|nr:hypothetical protein [Paracoccaceae bacterium]